MFNKKHYDNNDYNLSFGLDINQKTFRENGETFLENCGALGDFNSAYQDVVVVVVVAHHLIDCALESLSNKSDFTISSLGVIIIIFLFLGAALFCKFQNSRNLAVNVG